ncbi:MAG: radical SAM protein [Actinobacteria bacterium]|nr:MAG: radical SAM protein [Actinomycetota bacterium]
MRWVLIRPRNHSPYYDPEIQEPLGLEYLAASRQARGDAVLVLDGAISGSSDVKVARRAASFEPDVIGFSVMTAQEAPSVRAIHSELTLAVDGRRVGYVAGGNLVSTEPENADRLLPRPMLLVRNEGEAELDEIAKSWAAGESDETERVRAGRTVAEIDRLPFPLRPFASQILGSGWAFNLQGSRGCCGGCRHCASPGMTSTGRNRWRGRSPAGIVDEIEELKTSFGAESFNFVDEDFLGPNAHAAERARDFAGELRKRKHKISFGIQVRPDSLSDEIVETLTDVGLVYVFVGVESDDPEDFRRWGRPWTADPYRFVDRLRERGAEVNAGVMLFHSHSTFEGIRRFARKLAAHRLLEYRSAINRQDAMPGSRLYREAAEAGLIDPMTPGPQHVPFVNPGIEEFRRDLLVALGPLGPPSMEALCSLPPLLSSRYHDSRFSPLCHELMRIISHLDEATVETFFALLDAHEKGTCTLEYVSEMQRKNLEVATSGAEELAGKGFARSFEELREAIRIDAKV